MSNILTSTRERAPKGRIACSTCKTRHVRCDGKKPRCTPCQKSSRHCEYLSDPVRPGRSQLKVVLYQPNNDLALQRMSPNPDQTSVEGRAFDFFRTKVAMNLGGLFDPSFWSRDILQAAQHEPPIHHAIVALASLSEAMLKTADHSPNTSWSPETFAIRQRTKAISNLSQNMQDSKESSTEVILMTCALFICFEMFRNDHESALRQISSGICVFYHWHSKLRRETQLSPDNPGEIVVQLQHIFERLLLQLVLFVDTKPQEWQFLMPVFTPAMPAIPFAFKSMDAARNCLNSCLCSILHGVLTSQLQGLENRQVLELPGLPESHASGDPLHEWAVSFESFMTQRKGKLSFKEQRAAIFIEIQQITGSILVTAGAFSDETVFDSFEASFSQIVSLASHLISNTDEPSQNPEPPLPAFDMGILPPLYFVASRCRHPSIRRQALHLLRKGPSQEGIWHSGMLSNLAERIMHIEETDCAGARCSEDIPASARISVLNAKIDSARRTVALHCCQRQFERTQVFHEEVAY